MPHVTTTIRPDGTVTVTAAADPERDSLASLQLEALAEVSGLRAVTAHLTLFAPTSEDEPAEGDE